MPDCAFDRGRSRATGVAMNDEIIVDLKPTKCVTAEDTRQAYLNLVASRKCGKGTPCMRDSCKHCRPINLLIDLRGQQCEARGCTLRSCIYDDGVDVPL